MVDPPPTRYPLPTFLQGFDPLQELYSWEEETRQHQGRWSLRSWYEKDRKLYTCLLVAIFKPPEITNAEGWGRTPPEAVFAALSNWRAFLRTL